MCLCLYQLSYWLCRWDLFPVSENQKVQLLSQWYECGKRCTLMIEILCLCFLVHTKLNQFSCQLAVSLIFPCCCWNRSDVWEPCNRLWAGCTKTPDVRLWCFHHAAHLILHTSVGWGRAVWCQGTFRALPRYPWAVFSTPAARPRLYAASHPNV